MKVSDHWRPDQSDFIQNPFPHYEALRNHSSIFESPSGDYVLLDHEDVKSVLLDKNFESGLRKSWVDKICLNQDRIGRDFSETNKAITAMLTQFNPPEHTELRNFLSKEWPGKDQLKAISEKYSNEVVNELPASGDIVHMISRKLPKKVMNHILGLRLTNPQQVEDGVIILRVLDPYITLGDLEMINNSATRLYEDVKQNVEQLTNLNLFSKNILEFQQSTSIAFDPISMIIFLFISGLDTTSSLISSSILYLLNHKDIIEQLYDDRLRTNFIHEILRLQSPVQITGRINRNESNISGITIPSNRVVTLAIAAANRDPKVFERPDELSLNRDNHKHLGFGYGIHYCLGSQLAIFEADALIKGLLPILPAMELKGLPTWGDILSLRNIRTLSYSINGSR